MSGVEFLHRHNIAHRDLKPRNILVFYQHYCDKEETFIETMYKEVPIICKVADFGLSWSLSAQT